MKKVILLLFTMLVLGLGTSPAHAQNPDPKSSVLAEMVGAGYDVLDAGYFPDAQGNPTTNTVFVQMDTITTDFGARYLSNQTLNGFDALSRYYPNAEYYVVVLNYDRWLYFFVTTPQDFDDLVQKRVTGANFWKQVRGQARVYDRTAKKYVSEKDFLTQNQTDKNQTDKDFTGQAKSPLPPVNTNPNVQAENILVEPTTTFLPADGKAQAFVFATLTDADLSGLPGRGVSFTYEVKGQEEKPLGTTQTDRFGTARAPVLSSRPLDLVLIHAATTTLNAGVQMVVGAPPADTADAQVKAVIKGLTSQGYKDVDADYVETTGPAGNVVRQAIAVVRVTSKGFDREVYSQLSRMLGTLRIVMPKANLLRPVLLYAAPDGHDYVLLFSLPVNVWDEYVKGNLGENQLWQSLDYDGALNENGVPVDQKDFLSKNFSSVNQPHLSSAPRTVESTLTNEEWGAQLTVGSFLVPIGGTADTFTVSDLNGAGGFTLYATPDYTNPIFTYTPDNASALNTLRLEAGQYIIQVTADTPPARVELKYIEHLTR